MTPNDTVNGVSPIAIREASPTDPAAQPEPTAAPRAAEGAVDLPAYYINLERSTDRRDQVEALFTPLLPKLRRMNAATPADVPSDFREASIFDDPVKMRTAATANSHMKCWRAILMGDAPGAFVFEDDILPCPNVEERLSDFAGHPDRALYDFVFVNRRATLWLQILSRDLLGPDRLIPLEAALAAIGGGEVNPASDDGAKLPAIGLDGYWVTKRGAAALLHVFENFKTHHFTDWTTLSTLSARAPRAHRHPVMRHLLERKGLADLARQAGGVSAAIFRTPIVKQDNRFVSVRRFDSDAEAEPNA